MIKSAPSAKHQTFETLLLDRLVVGGFFSPWLYGVKALGQILHLQHCESGRREVNIKDGWLVLCWHHSSINVLHILLNA